jgi:hypothetical protein
MTFHKKDPEENHGEPFDYVCVKKTALEGKNVLIKSAIREPNAENKCTDN